MPKSKIPDRWEQYSKIGKVILGTSIMPIKVPLRESLTKSLQPEERFSPSSLMHLLQENNLKLGGIVDLTYTTKYYDSMFFQENGVNYKKVFTAGHVIPDNDTYNKFADAIKEVSKEGEVICVHCTHGLNRSGYMICRYMIEGLNIEPQRAIQLFEEARGHKIERQNYLSDLMRRKPGVTCNEDSDYTHGFESDASYTFSRPSYGGNKRANPRWNSYPGPHDDGRGLNHQVRGSEGYRSFNNDRQYWDRDGINKHNNFSYPLNRVPTREFHNGRDMRRKYGEENGLQGCSASNSGWNSDKGHNFSDRRSQSDQRNRQYNSTQGSRWRNPIPYSPNGGRNSRNYWSDMNGQGY